MFLLTLFYYFGLFDYFDVQVIDEKKNSTITLHLFGGKLL